MRLQVSKKSVFLSLLFSLALVTACCVHQNPFFGSHTLRKAKKSVVKIDGLTSVNFTVTSTSVKHQASLEMRSTASGSIVKHYGDLSIILTAAHVCGLMDDQAQAIMESFIGPTKDFIEMKVKTKLRIHDIEGRIYDAIQIYAQKRTDTCVIATKKIPQTALDVADKEVDIGEEVFNIGLPNGIWSPNFIPMFDGRYLGHFYSKYDRAESSCYSIPGARGQSGSPIFNSYGQVVGMIHSVYNRYNHLSLSSTTQQIRSVLNYGMKKVESQYERYVKILRY